MAFYPPNLSRRYQLDLIRRQFAQADGIPWQGVLTAQDIERFLQEEQVYFGATADAFWTPMLTLWAFITQCISDDKCCFSAVVRVIFLTAAAGEEPCSPNTGAYCRARAKLPESFLRRLMLHVGWQLEQRLPDDWRWQGHRCFVVDGSTLTMADTKANQQRYPQQSCQKKGLGFPILRIVVLFSMATGAVLAVAWSRYTGKKTGEISLFKQILDSLRDQLQAGDVLVGDRTYCSFWMYVLARHRQLQMVCRIHHSRQVDFRRGYRLGRCDHLLTWSKEPRPVWLSKTEHKELLATLADNPLWVRELEIAITIPGFRTRKLILATTLLSAERYSKTSLGPLYRQRWRAELHLRSLKQRMWMDHLRCKTPEMVHKEILAHLLADNLICLVIAQAALAHGKAPCQISFNATRQSLVEDRVYLAIGSAAQVAQMAKLLWLIISRQKVGHRPDRVEPRAVKGRPKPHRLLMMPRGKAIAAILRGSHRFD